MTLAELGRIDPALKETASTTLSLVGTPSATKYAIKSTSKQPATPLLSPAKPPGSQTNLHGHQGRLSFEPRLVAVKIGVAVLLDAALVRLLLLPVLLRLMGAHAWYLPRWAGRVLPDVRFGHS